jgi:hypothetical protein
VSICGLGPFGSSVGARQPEKSSRENKVSSYCTAKKNCNTLIAVANRRKQITSLIKGLDKGMGAKMLLR